MTALDDKGFDFTQPKEKKQWRKKRTFIKCLDCRTLIGTKLAHFAMALIGRMTDY